MPETDLTRNDRIINCVPFSLFSRKKFLGYFDFKQYSRAHPSVSLFTEDKFALKALVFPGNP